MPNSGWELNLVNMMDGEAIRSVIALPLVTCVIHITQSLNDYVE